MSNYLFNLGSKEEHFLEILFSNHHCKIHRFYSQFMQLCKSSLHIHFSHEKYDSSSQINEHHILNSE